MVLFCEQNFGLFFATARRGRKDLDAKLGSARQDLELVGV
jgi:hypothetical protein